MRSSRALQYSRRLAFEAYKFPETSVDSVTNFIPSKRQFRNFNWYSIFPKRIISNNAITMQSTHDSNKESEKPKHTNRLINEKSPYLLQHAHNPVDWYPWGQEAFNKAKKENKLIFLSVGYSTCHWCHVMEKQSFEKEEIAQIMNKHYVNIKVDREERPDIDKIYMLFIMATTGGGGWPMSVFLTPDLRPVTGGTYFPPEDSYGRPGFKTFLTNLANKWKQDHAQFMDAGGNILDALRKISLLNNEQTDTLPHESSWNKCAKILMDKYEPEFGGFSLQPKFPQVSNLDFLFHYYARNKKNADGIKCLEMCLHTLSKISKGGIHDHVSSGFARYSVDNDWQVPHFEKMLYDQAQLLIAFTDAFKASKKECFADVAKNIVKYVNRDLRHPLGGYYSAEDADSYPTYGATEKKEGAFYVWEYEEIKSLLNQHLIGSTSYFEVFCDYFNVEPHGNVSPDSDPHEELVNKNVLIIYESKESTAEKFDLTLEEFEKAINESLEILHEARQKRPRPHLDTKILCSWNGLMISGLARAGEGLGCKEYVNDAIKTANFIHDHLYEQTTKTLLHSCYKGEEGGIEQIENKIDGFLDDYAFLIKGLLDLYEATFDQRWLTWARDLQATQNTLFWDESNGGYFTSSSNDETLVLRLKEDHDGAEPSGNSVSCHNLLRLSSYADKGALEGGGHDREVAGKLLGAFTKLLTEQPPAMPHLMSALMVYQDSPLQVLIAGDSSDPQTLKLLDVIRTRLLPGRVLALVQPGDKADVASMSDLMANRMRCVNGQPTAYVCRHHTCSLPVTDVQALESLLDEDASN